MKPCTYSGVPKLLSFWAELAKTIRGYLGFPLPFTSKVFVLDLRPKHYEHISKEEWYMILQCLLEAKLLIAFQWKRPGPPSISQWFHRLWLILAMQKLIGDMEGRHLQSEEQYILLCNISLGAPYHSCSLPGGIP